MTHSVAFSVFVCLDNNNYNARTISIGCIVYQLRHKAICESSFGPLGGSQSAPGGRQLVGDAANFWWFIRATASWYLSELCTLVDDVASWRHLRSVCQNELVVPCRKLSSTAGVLLVSQPHRSGILWQIICIIWLLDLTVFCFHTIRHNVLNALDIIWLYAI